MAFGFDSLQTRYKVHFRGTDEVSLLDVLVTDPEDREKPKRKVVGDESGSAPVVLKKDAPGREKENDGDHDDTVPSSRGTVVESGTVGEGGTSNALNPETLLESDVNEADATERLACGERNRK